MLLRLWSVCFSEADILKFPTVSCNRARRVGTRKVPFLYLAAVTSVVFLGHLKFCFLHSETILSALPTTFWSSPLPLMPGPYFVLFLLSKRQRQKQAWAPCLSCLTHHPRHGVTASGDPKAADGQSSGLHCVCFK